MPDRDTLAKNFLARSGFAGATRRVLAGDASNRRYDRLTNPEAVLMDAPPEKGEDVRPFVQIARHLVGLGLSAPRILAQDEEAGFLLLEDLGDDLFARVIPAQPSLEETLYTAATDLLVALHKHGAPEGLPTYTPTLMAELAALSFDWYLPAALGQRNDMAKTTFQAEIETVLGTYAVGAQVLIQRDYHAENLLWLPHRSGVARVGLLDFQDAMAGHPAYDLVSLLEDARRDVPAPLQDAMIMRYLALTGLPEVPFRAAYAALGAQRNLRILGVFARLCIRDGKPQYTDLIPRVWGHLQRDLTHPALAQLRSLVLAHLPAPTPATCQRIKDQCKISPSL